MRKIIVVLLAILFVSGLKAEIKLPSIMSDNMVLQQLSEVNLWGTAKPDEKVLVNVSWRKELYHTVAGKDGKWALKIVTPSAAENQTVIIQGSNKITISNVLIGETWLCSGQSNIEYTVEIDTTTEKWCLGIENKEKYMSEANYKNIHLFHVKRNPSLQELDDCPGEWVICTPKNIKLFSAIGYIFGRKIHLETSYPVGIVESSFGGTRIEAWTKSSVIEGNPLYNTPVVNSNGTLVSTTNTQSPQVPRPQFPKMSEAQMEQFRVMMRPSVMWNGMINPICPYTFKGVLWYQGESNANNAKAYRQMFTNMIESWRKEFGNPSLPFYFVQLAPYDEPRSDYAALREAQTLVWNTVVNTGMVVITDAGMAKNIHPTNKTIPAERLAAWALNRDYGHYVPCESPVLDSFYEEDNSIVVKFKYATGGLKVANGDKELLGFTVSSNGKDFYPAKAVIISSNAIRVSAPEVSKPTTVRFGWSNWLVTNLYNDAGFPASPFRTDNN